MPIVTKDDVIPDYFCTEDDIRLSQKGTAFWAETALDANQKVIDSDYLKLVGWKDHPNDMVREVFGFNCWTCPGVNDQLDIVLAVRDHERVTVRSGNGIGKTAVAAHIVMSFLYSHYPSIVITTAPTTRQVEKLLWGEIRFAHKGADMELGGELLMTEIRLDENWYAVGFSTDEPEKFQGFHAPNVLIVVDEAGGVPEVIFEGIEGILTSANARILLIGNPTDPSSFFGRTHLHPRESKGWHKLHLDCYNSPNVKAGKNLIPSLCAFDWPAKKLDQWGEYNPFYQVRVKGEFPESGEDTLVPYHMVHSALERTLPGAGKKVFGVDVARFGGDKSVIARLWGQQFRILKKLYNLDGPGLADRIVEQLKLDGNEDVEEVKIDVIGFGASCYDSLRGKKKSGNKIERTALENVRIIPVNVAEKVKSKKAKKDYYNVRAEAGFMVRDMFEQGEIDIEDEELGVQAANLKYGFSQGRYLLEEKDKFKDRLRESPDELDSLIVAKALTRGAGPAVY